MARMAVDLAALHRWSADAARARTRLTASVDRVDDIVSRPDTHRSGEAAELFAGRHVARSPATSRRHSSPIVHVERDVAARDSPEDLDEEGLMEAARTARTRLAALGTRPPRVTARAEHG